MQDAGGVGRAILAVFAGFLPRALWPRLEEAFVPVYLAAIASGTVQLVAGLGLGIPGFLVYAWRVANENTDLMLAAASQGPRAGEASSAMSVAGSMFSPIAFVFFTPLGLTSLYLTCAGFVRLVAAMVDEPFGDPILTGVHRLAVSLAAKRATAVERTRRAALEGDEIPDRVRTGAECGVPAAEHVVVAARRKPGWEEGVLVVTGSGWFRIGRIFEEYHDGGLRTLYPLLRSPETEVMRRAVSYRLPGDEEGAWSEPLAGAGTSEPQSLPVSEYPWPDGKPPSGTGPG